MRHVIVFGLIVCLMVVLIAYVQHESITTCDPTQLTQYYACP